MASPPAVLAWDEEMCAYDFGPGHPMTPLRLRLTARLCRDLGLLEPQGPIALLPATPATDDELAMVHDRDYIAAVRAASEDPRRADLSFGIGSDDTPAFRGMHQAASCIAGTSARLARHVWAGGHPHAVNFCGGLHHAQRRLASGFCVYNDAAVAIATLLDSGAQRVGYIDLDVHHGDGVEAIFADDPRVLTISVHESPRTLFPGIGGEATYVGGPKAQGSAVNVALPAGTGDAGWLRAVDSVVTPVIRAERPDVVVSQHGCDTHVLDPLAHLLVSVDAQRAAAALVHDLAHEVAQGRWLALGGGGYEVVDVVPRSWAHLVAIAGHIDLPPESAVPQVWREYVSVSLGTVAPSRMTDGGSSGWVPWSQGHDPADPVDRAILATRKAAFPLVGLDPWFD